MLLLHSLPYLDDDVALPLIGNMQKPITSSLSVFVDASFTMDDVVFKHNLGCFLLSR